MKKVITISLVNLLNVFLLIPVSYAAKDLFKEPTEKLTSGIESFMGLAKVLCAVAIIGACVALFFNKVSKGWAIGIVGASVVIGSAMQIAEWLVG